MSDWWDPTSWFDTSVDIPSDFSMPQSTGFASNPFSSLPSSGSDYASSVLNPAATTYGNDLSGGQPSGQSGISTGDSAPSGGSVISRLAGGAGNTLGGGIGNLLGAQLAGAGISGLGAYLASQNQAGAANQASNVQQQMFNQTLANQAPYMQAGAGASNALQGLTGAGSANPLTSALLAAPTANLSQAALEQTPGYQFARDQGLQSVQNSAAARGLGSSGAALKGAADYATGLANNTYQQQYQNAVTNQTNQFNRLMSLATLGQNAASNTGAQATQTGANIGNNTVQAANAGSAALTAGAGNTANVFQSLPIYELLAQQAAKNNGSAQSSLY